MKLSNELQLQTFKTNCKNLPIVNEYIQYYQQYTRNTVENILKLSSLIVEMKEKEQSGELDKSDMKYFCFSVGLKREGSTFRKFEQIGKHSEVFWKYVDKLPDSYTVLYEITTLDSDKFDELMKNNKITSYVTLKDIKKLGDKVTSNQITNISNSFKVNFDLKTMSKESKQKLGVICKCLYQMTEVEFTVPKHSQTLVVDTKNKDIESPVTEKELMLLED